MINVEQTKAQLSEWHIKYCLTLNKLKPETPRWPTAQIFLGKPAQSLGGQYRPRDHLCRYSICYALTALDEFEQVVAHEVCHAFQRQTFSGRQRWHGEYFHYLMELCGYRGGNRRCHSMPNRAAQKMYRTLHPYKEFFNNIELDLTARVVDKRAAAACDGR